MEELKKRRIQNFGVPAALVVCFLAAGVIAQKRAFEPPSDASGEGAVQETAHRPGLLPDRLNRIDFAVEEAIKEGEVPGAVVLVGMGDSVEYFKAFGNRSLQPNREPMTKDTIFDVSSLTKVLATTPSIMLLVEDGVLRLGERVNRYLPLFKGGGKSDITVRQLLTHYSGLPADFDLSKRWFGYESAMAELWKISTNFNPGEEFVYSDINFIALGEIVHVLSGRMLDEFARERIFIPLGMKDTCFRPSPESAGRIAPTETRRSTLQYLHGQGADSSIDTILRGEVHDPTAWRMDGVAGHAGLFSSAEDIAVYARTLLNSGMHSGGRFLSPLTVRAMTSIQSPAGAAQTRGYGWDIQTDYTSPRGDIFMEGYGHTGFTGVSLWIHPPTNTYVIILANRVHPKGGKNMNHLRSVVANIVAAAVP